jgi:very-short-patch-repair endonuclease
MPLPRRYTKRGSAYTRERQPGKKTEKRIVMPQPIQRPLRFQTRSLIRSEYIQKSPYWFILHRRGIPQKMIGENPLEARAIPQGVIRGTLPERIIYKALVDDHHLIEGIDFSYQSSLQGGRLDTGGIVADFLFPYLRIIINPMGPTHYETLRMYKDDEQTMALAELGYQVYYIDEHKVYDEVYFTNWLKEVIGQVHLNISQVNEVESDEYNVRQVSLLLEDFQTFIRGQ